MRVCLSFLVVEKLREGKSPTEACRLGIQRLKQVVRATGKAASRLQAHAAGCRLSSGVTPISTQPDTTTPASVRRLKLFNLSVSMCGTGGSGEQGRWHEQLTVGVVCVDKHGQVGAASTLGTHNPHRHRPAFPFVVRAHLGFMCVARFFWRQEAGTSRPHMCSARKSSDMSYQRLSVTSRSGVRGTQPPI